MVGPAPADVRTVVFDIDGTLLDSAAGILAGFQRALRAGGVSVPEESALRVHLGPPLRDVLVLAGVAPDRLDDAAQAYHDFYLAEGLQRAAPYPGIEALLTRLVESRVTLATASAKRTTTAQAIVAAHGLAPHFTVIGGTDETRLTKSQTIAGVLTELAADPATTIMIGDRHHDIDGAHAVDIRAVGALWGYGVAGELARAGADWLAEDVAACGRLLGV
ncbi:MAG TPA: HAD hydrolase-like protein [Microlunatus sp.]